MRLVSLGSKLGVVPQCTLTGSIKTLTHDGNTYCMVNHGKKHQDAAIDFCKKMNAGLPLPKSKEETTEYLKITGSEYVWIGLTDSTKSGDMAAWKDLDGNPIGTRFVNLRVIKFSLLFRFLYPLILCKVENEKWRKMATKCGWNSCIL